MCLCFAVHWYIGDLKCKYVREESKTKNVIKRGKVQSAENKKVQNSKFGLLREGGSPDFQFFPKCKCKLYMLQLNKNKIVIK